MSLLTGQKDTTYPNVLHEMAKIPEQDALLETIWLLTNRINKHLPSKYLIQYEYIHNLSSAKTSNALAIQTKLEQQNGKQ